MIPSLLSLGLRKIGSRKRRSVRARRGFVLASVGLVLGLATTAQTAPHAKKAGEKQAALCAVSGQVLTAAEGAPLKSSRVVLLQEGAGSHPQAFAANTDGDGRFEIKKITPGQYRFTASHTSFIAQQYQARGMSGGVVLTLTPGQEVNDGLFRLVRAAVITGRVVDESGEAMAKVMVTALRKQTAEELEDWGPRARKDQKESLIASSAAATDDRGEYRIFGLRPGEYYVKAAESDTSGFYGYAGDDDGWVARIILGNQYAPVFYPGVVQADQAQSVALGPGDEVEADLAMRHVKTVEVAGHVVASDGRPTIQAYVALYVPDTGNWGNELSTSTGAKGEFSIKGVPPGNYVLSAQILDEDNRHMTHQKLEVGNDNIDSIVVAFGTGTTVRGRIVAANTGLTAFDRIRVHLESTSESDIPSFAFARAKQDGSFQVEDVLDGNYALQVGGVEQSWYVKSARLGAEDILQKGLEVERGASGGTLEIVISSATAQLEGAVTEHDKPVAGAQVRVKPDPETPYNRMRSTNATTDQNGHFVLSTLPPGKYRVIAKLPSVSSETPATASEPKTVTLGEHDHQAVQLTLAPPSE
jgi:5-hydroxyisourate hydrolase-like protein (transthyretin family)